jgi:hypothetical protein
MKSAALHEDAQDASWRIIPVFHQGNRPKPLAWLSAYAVAKQLGVDAHTVAKYSPFDASGVAVA